MPDNYLTRRALIIGTIVIIALIFGYAIYSIIILGGRETTSRPSPQAPITGSIGGLAVETPILPQVTPLQNPTIGLEPKIQEQTLRALTDFSVISPMINKKQDGVLVYKKDGGTMYAIDFNAQTQKISNITIVGLIKADWSPIKDRAALFYIDNEVLKSFLHTGTSSVFALPRDIKSFSWSPSGKQFAYLLSVGDNIGLFISDASGKNTKQVFTTPLQDAQIKWITSDTIMFQTAPSGQASGFVFKYSIASKTFRRVLGPLYGLTALWSPEATHALISFTNGEGKKLAFYLYNTSTNELKRLDFITLPEKCVWIHAREFYCAVPNTFSSSAILPDDYLRAELVTHDRILRYNLKNNEVNLVLSGGAMDMTDLIVTEKNDYLIFVNRVDGILWRYKLPQEPSK